MASSKVKLFIFYLFFASIANTISSHPLGHDPPTLDDIDKWCDTVPHPESCKFFMTHMPGMQKPKEKTEFRSMTVKVALDRALAAHSHAWRWGQRCKSQKERAAWADCVRLYDQTVLQLNRTLHGVTSKELSCTNFDAQTWLSTALTNLDTCRAGSEDMNVTDVVWPHVTYNVSDLISNGLAINQGLIGGESFATSAMGESDYPYPSWVRHEDRRLIEHSRSLAVSRASFVVAQDGSGQFRTVQSAINAAARSRIRGRKVIHVKRGTYRENIYVNANANDIMLVGDGTRFTIITGSRSVKGGYTTYNSATVGIDGLRFMARDITFQNTAGPQMGQAVALRSGSDLSVFYRCAFKGYQDTIFVHSQRQFYKACVIYGTIDIIFGNAAVVFQDCNIYVRKPITNQKNVITAQGRGDPNQNTGIVIHNSRIEAAGDLAPLLRSFGTYLGRPWQQYSRTIVMQTYLGQLVQPEGWLEWGGKNNLNTLYYGEYKNSGPGSNLRGRVKWPGYHIISTPSVASRFTVGAFITGRAWLPSTGVPFDAGL